MKFQQIVIGVDFSPNCRQALREASFLRRDPHTGLVAVHVVEEFLVSDFEKHLKLNVDEIRDRSELRLKHWVSGILGAAHTVQCEAVVGNPFEGLIHATERHRADLLVLGSRGQMASAGHPGTVASKCIRKTNIDVMLVRRAQTEAFKHVVGCVEFDETSERVMERAVVLAEADGARCSVLHIHVPRVLTDYGLDPFPAADTRRWEESTEHQERFEFRSFLEKNLPSKTDLSISTVFQKAFKVADGIKEFIHHSHADLVVLGTRGRNGLMALLLGTTAERLLYESPCSLLVVKNPD